MQATPFVDQLQSFGREKTFVNATRVDLYQSFMLAINRMKPESAAADGDSVSPVLGTRATAPEGAPGNRIV